MAAIEVKPDREGGRGECRALNGDDLGTDGMSDNEDEELCYDVWIEEALRGVIFRALSLVVNQGLPGEHHFYITFHTTEDGVQLSPQLLATYPEEMTVVLQHQFDDLSVDEGGFAVTLRFSGKAERLIVPFSSVTSFADPSVNFGLQLKMEAVSDESVVMEHAGFPGEDEPEEDGEEAAEPKTGEVIALDSFRKKS